MQLTAGSLTERAARAAAKSEFDSYGAQFLMDGHEADPEGAADEAMGTQVTAPLEQHAIARKYESITDDETTEAGDDEPDFAPMT